MIFYLNEKNSNKGKNNNGDSLVGGNNNTGYNMFENLCEYFMAGEWDEIFFASFFFLWSGF